MLLNHHVDGLLGVIEVELVVLSLLLLRILLLFIVVQRMLWSITVYVTASHIVDRVGTGAGAQLATTDASALGPAEDLLLQLHLLANLPCTIEAGRFLTLLVVKEVVVCSIVEEC